MVKMPRVGDGLQKGLISLRSADVRRRTAALRTDKARVACVARGRSDLLQRDGVRPILAVHIVVVERAPQRQDIGQRRGLGREQA
jgi:hypothetical protein